jgi:hypothetical protein
MTVDTAARPAPDEHAPYYGKYVALVPEAQPLEALERQLEDMLPPLRALDEAKGAHRYAPDKWSVRQLIGHLIDSERVFAYRALRFARGDRTPLAGFDENTYADAAGSDRLPVQALVDELELVRRASLALFRGLEPAAWLRRGIASDNEVSVRALAFIIAGHGRHHVGVLRERYRIGS